MAEKKRTYLTTQPGILNLGSNGSISGVPTNAGTYNFTAQVSDANGSTAAQALNIQVNPPATTPIALVQSANVDPPSSER